VAWGIFPRVRPVFWGVFKVWLRIEFISIVVLVSWLGMLIMLAGNLKPCTNWCYAGKEDTEMGTFLYSLMFGHMCMSCVKESDDVRFRSSILRDCKLVPG
jgi:hypothetical protein